MAKRRKGSQPREARRDQSHVHDPGGPSSHEMRSGAGEDSHTPIDELPTTTDLANSFLQAEPKEEKAELQASVILSKPLDGSMQSNEASDLGVGNNLSLPAFLADFLKGVGDRIKLEIQDVELDLTLKVNRFSNGFQDSDSSDQMEDVILRLSIGKMDIEAVSASEETSDNFKDKDAHFVAVQERRRIIFTKIRVAVISEASLFADLAKSTVPPSPMSVHARSMARVAGKDRLTSASVNSATSSQLNAQQDIDQNSSKLQDPDIMNDVEQDPGIPCSLRTEGDSIHAQRHKQNLVERERPEWVLENPSNSGEDFVQKEQKSLQKKTVQAWESSYESDILHRPVRGQQDSDGIVPSQIPGEFISGLPTGHHIGSPNLSESQHWHDPSMQTTQGAASDASPPYSNQSSPDAEGLAESKIFTHEEASLYMSAVSGSLSRREDESVMIPGKWNSSSLAGENRHDSAESSSPGALGAIEHDKEQASRQDIQSSGIGQLSQVGSTTDNSPEITRPRSIGDEVILLTTHQEGSATLPHKESNSVSSETEGSSRHSKVSFPVSKAIISIDLVIAVVPTGSRAKTSNSQAPNQCDIHKSQRVPGSFEQKSEGFAASSMGGTPEISENDQAYRKHLSYSVEIGEIQILGDVGLTKMLILVIEQLNAFHNPDIVETDKNKSIIPSKSQGHDVSLVVKEIRWLFLDAVVEKPILRNPHGSLRGSGEFGSEGSELLLRADLNNFRIVRTDGRTSNTTKIVMGKVSFGYRSEDILSFDSDMKMRDSTRDVLAPTDDDIILIITQSQAMTSADLTTLPLHIVLDLRRLDETFSWFGGFSSVLDLGSSMMSTVTIVDKKPRNAQRGKKKRGVHFENSSPSRSVESHMTNVQNKVTARIGGFVFDLEGTRSSMRFGSTAMKIVSRAEGLGLQVDRVQLRGPELKLNPTSSPVTATLTNLRVEYLSMPKEVDLARLLNLVSPSKDKDAHDDDILLETLLRQRRQGAVVRATTESLVGNISRLDDLQHVSLLAEELKKLSAVAKYLPEDDRPGILALVLIKDFQVMVSVNSSFGKTEIKSRAIEGAHVTFPTLMALGIDAISVNRNGTEELLGPALPAQIAPMHDLPTVMARYIGNEMEPTVKIKLHSLHLDYHVSTVLNIMGLTDVVDTETVLAEMISSVITVAGRPSSPISPPKYSEQASRSSSAPISTLKSLKLDIALRDIVIGLNPHQSSAKGLFVFSETYLLLSDTETEQFKAVLDVKKGSLMLIDNVDNVIPITTMPDDIRGLDGSKGQVRHLSEMGYVPVGLVSAAKATVQVVSLKAGNRKAIDVEIRDNLLVLETCADSTQTLQNILNGLKPPMPVSLERKYLTEVVPIEDMLASFTGDAFATTTKTDDIPDKTPPLELEEGDMVDDEVPQNLEFVSSFYNPVPDAAYDEIADSMLDDDLESLASPSLVREIGDKNLLESFQDQTRVAPGNAPLYFREDHFGSKSETQDISRTGTEPKNDLSREREHDSNLSPLRCRVRDVHIIWNLYDGYDWQHTRDTISHAVESVQNKAMEQNAGKDKRKSLDPEDEENSVIGDFLFNSIYIGIPANHDPRDLTRQVNRNIDDLVSESEDYTSSTTSRSPSRQEQLPRPKGRQLNLKRSRSHKMTFELKGVSADITVLPPGSGETLSSIDLRVRDLEIFDHVPTSTWKKFATYMHDAGERQSGKSMIHLEILNVKPVPDLAASEIILKVSPNFGVSA